MAEVEATFAFGANPFQEYWIDAWQRGILFLDILRERGDTYVERKHQVAPNVLRFEAELILDGRSLPRPVNYALVRIRPPDGRKEDPLKPPFVVVDPRAGHGPGIGGMKQDSEIGVALEAGHPCYFIGFLPEPMPGQTTEDVWEAEAAFIAEVAARHPQADGKPVVIANCQAGWQTMIMAALHPEIAGPIMLAGSPLSYWAGVRGKNPLRYLGGVMGGTWATALAGDLGAGIFDGADLVANFERMNPANTWWGKPYNVYSKVDTEGSRFLDFETWWGSPVLLAANEMQWIADNLFVGNKLTSGELRTSTGTRVDLRNIRSPVIVFCSWGDDITPPPQALGWITDIYADEHEIVEAGRTIVYCLHQSIGHLGIFVSGKVATKEHRKFTSCMGMIDLMPPGLYEAVIAEVAPGTANPELVDGKYLFRLEPRTLADIRALGENPPEDDLRFATAERISDINLGLYRTLAQPIVRAAVTPASAAALRRLHPNRMRFLIFSDRNPFTAAVESLAQAVKENRLPVSPDNPLRVWEEAVSAWTTAALETFGHTRDALTEAAFLSVYGAPTVQALAGLAKDDAADGRRIPRDLDREAETTRASAALASRFESGGPAEAAVRALLYVRQAEGSADERVFALLAKLRAARGAARPRAELKALVQDQFLLLRRDEARALAAIPYLLPASPADRHALLDALHAVVGAPGQLESGSSRSVGAGRGAVRCLAVGARQGRGRPCLRSSRTPPPRQQSGLTTASTNSSPAPSGTPRSSRPWSTPATRFPSKAPWKPRG